MTLPIPRSGFITAQGGTVRITLDSGDSQNQNRENTYYENYEITGLSGIPAGRAV